MTRRQIGGAKAVNISSIWPAGTLADASLHGRQLLLDQHAAASLQQITLFNPVIYLGSGLRWSFFGVAEVGVGLSPTMTLVLMLLCLGAITGIFRSGCMLKS